MVLDTVQTKDIMLLCAATHACARAHTLGACGKHPA